MTDILFNDDRRTDPTGYDAAAHVLNEYFGGCCETEAADLEMLAIMWDAQKCACGECADCWLFTSHRGAMGPISFWVHGEHVEAYGMEGGGLWRAHDSVMAA